MYHAVVLAEAVRSASLEEVSANLDTVIHMDGEIDAFSIKNNGLKIDKGIPN